MLYLYVLYLQRDRADLDEVLKAHAAGGNPMADDGEEEDAVRDYILLRRLTLAHADPVRSVDVHAALRAAAHSALGYMGEAELLEAVGWLDSASANTVKAVMNGAGRCETSFSGLKSTNTDAYSMGVLCRHLDAGRRAG